MTAPGANGPSNLTPNQVPNSVESDSARQTRFRGARKRIFFSMRSVLMQPPGCRLPGSRRKCNRTVAEAMRNFLGRFAARREEACCRSDVDVRDEQPFFTVWLIAEQRPVGPHDRRSGWRTGARIVYTCEKAGVLGGATQHRFLMK